VRVVIKPDAAKAAAKLELDGVEQEGETLRVPAGEEHTLSVYAPGYIGQVTNVRGSLHEDKQLTITLDPAPQQPGTQQPGKSTSAASGLAADTNATNGRATAAPVAAKGTLNVGTSAGWCNVTIDGQAKGATPIAGVELSPGAHKVSCTTQDGQTLSANVTVVPNSTTRHKFTLP
jgi:hypothetical protein